MSLDELVHILQMAIGPVIIISGVGLILLSMTNRYGRAIDRSRHLIEARRTGREGRSSRIDQQIEVLFRRARILKRSITLATVSLSLVALIIIALFVTKLMGLYGGPLVVLLFISCMVCLIASLVLLILDINLSLRALELEIQPDD